MRTSQIACGFGGFCVHFLDEVVPVRLQRAARCVCVFVGLLGGKKVDHICIGVCPFDEAALRGYFSLYGSTLIEAGSRYGASGEGPSLYVRDPEGTVIELKSVA
jgi:hypothetical protein